MENPCLEFFKVFIPDLFSHQLSIPPAFCEHLGETPLPRYTITNPANYSWTVSLEKEGNRLFLREGWSEFVKDHALTLGDFLIFQYDGYKTFLVKIFGKNACAKDTNYTANGEIGDEEEAATTVCKRKRGRRTRAQKEQIKDEKPRSAGRCKENDESRIPNVLKHRKQSTSQQKTKCTVKVGKPLLSSERERAVDELDRSGHDAFTEERKKASKPHPRKQEKESGERSSLQFGNSLGVGRPKGNVSGIRLKQQIFMPRNSSMTRKKVEAGWPRSIRKQVKKEPHEYADQLKKKRGRSKRSTEPENRSPDVSTIEGRVPMVQYKAMRKKGFGTLARTRKTAAEIAAIDLASRHVSEHPSFRLFIAQAYIINHGTFVPAGFARTCIKGSSRDIHLQVSGRSWPVRLNIYEKYVCRLNKGWNAFVKGNHLRAGDVCVFELIKLNPVIFNVVIYRC